MIAAAANAQEVVYLRDGRVVEGAVTQQLHDDAITVRMRDGSTALFPMTEVESIIKDVSFNDMPDVTNDVKLRQRHKGLDFNLDLGYNRAFTRDDCDRFFIQAGFGKRFTHHFYWGASAGFMMPLSSGNTPFVPVATDFKFYFPIPNKTVVPGCTIRGGYVFDTATDRVIKMPESADIVIKPLGYVMLQIMPTVNLSYGNGKSDFVIGVGYTCLLLNRMRHDVLTVSMGFNLGKPMYYCRKR